EVESGSLLEGLETTGSDFQDVRRGSVQIPSIREDEEIPDVAPIAELEPTVSEEAESADLGLEPLVEEEEPAPTPPPAPKPRVTVPRPAPRDAPAAPPKVQPVIPRRPTPKATSVPLSPPPSAKAAPPEPPRKRKTVVEIPPLELEPDFDTATTQQGHEVDDQPLAL